jgi:uncharacterized membrane protein YqjE
MATNITSGRGPLEHESIAGLLGRLVADVSSLFRSEIALAKSELSEIATNAKLGLAALGVAVAVLLAGAMALVAALILGLAEVMAPWLAALLVGVTFAVVGFIMLATAKKKLSIDRSPLPRTQHSLQQDAAVIARRT